VYRSGFHESSHYGSVVITGPTGTVVHQRGDVQSPVFPRSSNKPFQAVAMLASGARLHGADLALAAASHSGEPMHVERVKAMLARIGLAEDDLRCPPALPMDDAARTAVLAAGERPRRRYMNCSGKHAGMLAACVAQGWPIDNYVNPDHPLQRSVAATVAHLSDEAPSAVGIDGCGAPLFAIPLEALARAFGRVAAAPPGTPERRVADAMRAYPDMVGGTGRDDTLLMRAHPELLVKGGAEGVHCAALPDGRCVAVKITDGGDRARMPVLVGGLRQLGLASDQLDELAVGRVLGGGRPVGTVELAPHLF
jgi:L-asparaginase II